MKKMFLVLAISLALPVQADQLSDLKEKEEKMVAAWHDIQFPDHAPNLAEKQHLKEQLDNLYKTTSDYYDLDKLPSKSKVKQAGKLIGRKFLAACGGLSSINQGGYGNPSYSGNGSIQPMFHMGTIITPNGAVPYSTGPLNTITFPAGLPH